MSSQTEAERRERAHREHQKAVAAETAAAAAAAEWTPLARLGGRLAEAALGDDVSAAAASRAVEALVAAVPVEEPSERDKEKERRQAEGAAADRDRDPDAPPGAAADPSRTGAAESRPADFSDALPALVPFEDAEETAEVCRFVADVGERNSGAADVAWRLLLDVTRRWNPTSEGDDGDENARERAARRRARERQPVDVQARGLRRRRVRFAARAKTGDAASAGGGVRNAKFERSFDGRRVAPARAPVPGGRGDARRAPAAASVAWSRLDSKQRRRAEMRNPPGRASQGGVLLSAVGMAGAEATTDSLPAAFFAVAATRHLAAAAAAMKGDDWRLLAEYHYVAGNFAAFDGSPARAEERLRAAAEAADLAEAEETARPRPAGREGGPPGGPPESGERLTAAAARAALSDIKLHAVVARADEKLAAGATAELLDTLGALLFPSQEEAEVQREGSHAPVVLTTDERKHALRVLRDAARVEAAKALGERGDADAADAALAVEVRAQISLFHFELAAAASPGRPSAVEVSKAMPPLCDAAREALAARGARAFAPDARRAAASGNAAAGDAFAALAAVFASLIEAQYASRAVEPGAAAAAARKRLRGRSGVLLQEEQASNLVLERASEALAAVQQLVARADNPLEGLPPGEDEGDAVAAVTPVAAETGRPALESAPSPLGVLELHERLHGALADCRCCCGSFQRGAFLRASLPRLAAAREPLAAEAKRLRAKAQSRAETETETRDAPPSAGETRAKTRKNADEGEREKRARASRGIPRRLGRRGVAGSPRAPAWGTRARSRTGRWNAGSGRARPVPRSAREKARPPRRSRRRRRKTRAGTCTTPATCTASPRGARGRTPST